MGKERFEEVDVIRGLAVLLMVTYHAIFDIQIVGLMDLGIGSLPLEVFADVTAGTFFSVVGISLYISFSRTKREGKNVNFRLRKYFSRGIKLIGWGAIVTVVTYFLFPDLVVLFGALHFIGASVIIGYTVLELTEGLEKLHRIILLISLVIAVFLVSGEVRNLQSNNPFFLWLGIIPSGFQSLDYYPVFPWFGFVVSGLILGETIYPLGTRRWANSRIKNSPLEFLGRHALVVYFFHQPVIYLSTFLLAYLSDLEGGGLTGQAFELFPW
ncbi:DUF1624 domain-containing protein [Candidatus Bipolaricaulota bacterium]|nr:DUF1624 domain-containing protein [Candidatus Bipolaricaulota bacterium]